jgi:hypothetical protein
VSLLSSAKNELSTLFKKADSYVLADNTLDVFAFDTMLADGLCPIKPGMYSKTLAIENVNYQHSPETACRIIFDAYGDLLSLFDGDMHIQLNLVNSEVDLYAFLKTVCVNKIGLASADKLIDDYNALTTRRLSKARNRIRYNIYLTFSVIAPDVAEAHSKCEQMQVLIDSQLLSVGSSLSVLGGNARLALMANLLGRGKHFVPFDFIAGQKQAISPKTAFAPELLSARPEKGAQSYFALDDGYGQVLFMSREIPNNGSDKILFDILKEPYPLNISVHLSPMDTFEAIEYAKKQMLRMGRDKYSKMLESAGEGILPEEGVGVMLGDKAADATDQYRRLRDEGQHFFLSSFVISHIAPTREDLFAQRDRIVKIGRKRSIVYRPLRLKQWAGLNAALPIGRDTASVSRGLNSFEASLLSMPFTTKQIIEEGGVYYGEDRLSGSPIVKNRKHAHINTIGIIAGGSGSGKSFAAGNEIFGNFFLNPDDYFRLIDPKGERTEMVKAYGGQVVQLSADSHDHINPFDLPSEEVCRLVGINDSVTHKVESTIASITALMAASGYTISPLEISLIDKACRRTYDLFSKRETLADMPTFVDFYKTLETDETDQAQMLAKSLEAYVYGSLNTFAHHTNINRDARLLSYECRRLSSALMTFAMQIEADDTWNLMLTNHARAIRTWLYIDEMKQFATYDRVMEYMEKFILQGRGYGLIPTGIIQNPSQAAVHPILLELFLNSEFLLLLAQEKADIDFLRETIGLDDNLVKYLTHSKPGEGLMRIGKDTVLPFSNRFPQDSSLYRLWSTDPAEAEARRRAGKTGSNE